MTWNDVLKEVTKSLADEIRADRAVAKHYHLIFGKLSDIPAFKTDVQEMLYRGAQLIGSPSGIGPYIVQAYLI